MSSKIVQAAEELGITVDLRQGFTEIAPSVIMFYGVWFRNNKGLGRQRRFIALYDHPNYRIELYEDQSII